MNFDDFLEWLTNRGIAFTVCKLKQRTTRHCDIHSLNISIEESIYSYNPYEIYIRKPITLGRKYLAHEYINIDKFIDLLDQEIATVEQQLNSNLQESSGILSI